MAIHDLKSYPEYFDAVVSGAKRAELRIDDREPPYAVDDTLVLLEYKPDQRKYTGRSQRVRVTHLFRQPEGIPVELLPEGVVMMSIAPI